MIRKPEQEQPENFVILISGHEIENSLVFLAERLSLAQDTPLIILTQDNSQQSDMTNKTFIDHVSNAILMDTEIKLDIGRGLLKDTE